MSEPYNFEHEFGWENPQIEGLPFTFELHLDRETAVVLYHELEEAITSDGPSQPVLAAIYEALEQFLRESHG